MMQSSKLFFKFILKNHSFFFLLFSFLFSTTNYRVVKGDSYSLIAKKFKIKQQELIDLNQNETLREGMLIDLPSHFYYVVKKNDSLSKIAERFQIKLRLLEKINNYPRMIYVDKKILIPLSYEKAQFNLIQWNEKNLPTDKNSLKKFLKKIIKNQDVHMTNVKHLKNTIDFKSEILKIKFHAPIRFRKKKIIEFYTDANDAYHFGLLFSARNSKVLAVYQGKVIFYGLVRGLGKTVILSHLKKVDKQIHTFYTIYGNLTEFNDYYLSKNHQKNISLSYGQSLGVTQKRLFFAIFFEDYFLDPSSFFSR